MKRTIKIKEELVFRQVPKEVIKKADYYIIFKIKNKTSSGVRGHG